LAYALWVEIECTFEVGGPYDGLHKIIWHPGYDKSNQLSLERTTTCLSTTERVFDAVEDPGNPQCGVIATHQLRRWSPTGQICVFCCEVEKTLMAEYKRNGVLYRTNQKCPMGFNSITKFTVELCECAGIEKPKHGKYSNQGGFRFAISKMASKGVSAAENMGMARHRNASVNVVYQDPNGEDRLSRLHTFRVEQQMLATFGSNNGVNTGHIIMAQQQIQVQWQTAAQPAAQQIQAHPAPQVPFMQFAQPQTAATAHGTAATTCDAGKHYDEPSANDGSLPADASTRQLF
jgi:hypothetical protein